MEKATFSIIYITQVPDKRNQREPKRIIFQQTIEHALKKMIEKEKGDINKVMQYIAKGIPLISIFKKQGLKNVREFWF